MPLVCNSPFRKKSPANNEGHLVIIYHHPSWYDTNQSTANLVPFESHSNKIWTPHQLFQIKKKQSSCWFQPIDKLWVQPSNLHLTVASTPLTGPLFWWVDSRHPSASLSTSSMILDALPAHRTSARVPGQQCDASLIPLSPKSGSFRILRPLAMKFKENNHAGGHSPFFWCVLFEHLFLWGESIPQIS